MVAHPGEMTARDRFYSDRLEKTFFIIEATSFEQHTLWQNHHYYPTLSLDYRGFREESVSWDSLSGIIITIGHLGEKLVAISLSWVMVNGVPVLFWCPSSKVVCYDLIEKWFSENCVPERWGNGTRRSYTDANNFSHCRIAIKEYKDGEHSNPYKYPFDFPIHSPPKEIDLKDLEAFDLAKRQKDLDVCCRSCGRSDIRLYRSYGGFRRTEEDRCNEHLEEVCSGEDFRGWYVPLIVDDAGNAWGYTSVPQNAIDAFYGLEDFTQEKPYWCGPGERSDGISGWSNRSLA